jgi:hypothetical protein
MKIKLENFKIAMSAIFFILISNVSSAEENSSIPDNFFSKNNINNERATNGYENQLFFPYIGDVNKLVAVEIFYNKDCGDACNNIINNALKLQRERNDFIIYFHPIVLSESDYEAAIIEHISFSISPELFLKNHMLAYRENRENITMDTINSIDNDLIKKEFISKLNNEKKYSIGLKVNEELVRGLKIQTLPAILINDYLVQEKIDKNTLSNYIDRVLAKTLRSLVK